MKQIFDWLREQIDKEREPEYNIADGAFNEGLSVAISIINEAEAKWEAEHCTECENCGTKVEKDSNGDYVCGLCGRDTARLRELEEETDCCEWVLERELVGIPIYKTCHKTQPYYNDRDKKFCTYCGKSIKISEVE